MEMVTGVRLGTMFPFAEVPVMLIAIWLGLQWIPVSWVPFYETLLLVMGPMLVLAEGFAALTVILSAGQLWSVWLLEQNGFLQGIMALICIAAYFLSTAVVIALYYGGAVISVGVASLVAVLLTLVVVLTVGTLLVPHGTITDSALLYLYLIYNVWIVIIGNTKNHLHDFILRPLAPMEDSFERTKIVDTASRIITAFQQHVMLARPSLFRTDSLFSLVSSVLGMISVELVAILLVQMAVFVVATKMYQRSLLEDQDTPSSEGSSYINIFWPCFGKAAVVSAYTYAWLLHAPTAQTTISWYFDPSFWRWINCFLCVAIYTRHLLVNNDDSDDKMHFD